MTNNSDSKKNLKTFSEKAREFYNKLNQFVSENGDTSYCDLLFSNHDGKGDAAAAAELMQLKYEINGIAKGCEMLIKNVDLALEVYDESEAL